MCVLFKFHSFDSQSNISGYKTSGDASKAANIASLEPRQLRPSYRFVFSPFCLKQNKHHDKSLGVVAMPIPCNMHQNSEPKLGWVVHAGEGSCSVTDMSEYLVFTLSTEQTTLIE